MKGGVDPKLPTIASQAGSNLALADALNTLLAHLDRYVAFGSIHESVAVALFCAGTHVFERTEAFPILAFMSPVRRSGKTRALEVIEPIVQRAWPVIRPTEAVLFRKIDRDKPTLMLDEVDAIWNERGQHEGVRAILNAGNRPGITVPRTLPKGRGFDLIDFEVFCPKVLAGIGTLPDTVRDRAIVVKMARRVVGDVVEPWRRRDADVVGRHIGESLAELLRDAPALILELKDLPAELDDRARDGWEPLLAIADMAGGDWPVRARAAAVALSADRDDPDDETIVMELLRDIQSVFGEERRLSTTTLIDRLMALDLSPWEDLHGKQLSGRKLKQMLRPFGIKVQRDRNCSYYAFSDFVVTWSRYLPSRGATSATPATNPVADVADVGDPSD